MIKQCGSELVYGNHCDRRRTDIKFAPRIMRSEVNCFGRDLGLKDRRHRLRLAWQTAFHPAKLRRVERRQLHHGQAYTALIVEQLATKRIAEALDSVLCRAVGRLQGDAAVRERA